MKILIAPFAKKMREKTTPNPKDYPFTKDLVELLTKEGHEVVQIGVAGEEQVAPLFLKNLSYQETEEKLNEYDTFISVDSYLQHHAWIIGKRGIVLWGLSDPIIYGHDIHINLLKDRRYLRKEMFNVW